MGLPKVTDIADNRAPRQEEKAQSLMKRDQYRAFLGDHIWESITRVLDRLSDAEMEKVTKLLAAGGKGAFPEAQKVSIKCEAIKEIKSHLNAWLRNQAGKA